MSYTGRQNAVAYINDTLRCAYMVHGLLKNKIIRGLSAAFSSLHCYRDVEGTESFANTTVYLTEVLQLIPVSDDTVKYGSC